MPITKEELIEEIVKNARRDRKRLEKVADGLTGGFANFGKLSEEEDEQINVEAAAAFAEEISKIADSLTGINHELVEIVKLDKKSGTVPDRLDPSEVQDVYDEIQPEERN